MLENSYFGYNHGILDNAGYLYDVISGLASF